MPSGLKPISKHFWVIRRLGLKDEPIKTNAFGQQDIILLRVNLIYVEKKKVMYWVHNLTGNNIFEGF